MQDKSLWARPFTVGHNSVLRGPPVSTPTGPFNLVLVRVWPKVYEEPSDVPTSVVASGTGFLLSRPDLLQLTGTLSRMQKMLLWRFQVGARA